MVRAIDIVRIALETFGAPIYVRKEIVHNSYVVTDLAQKGAIFVNELDEVPEGARVIYSAHGVSPAVRQHAKERGLTVIDATCPLVTKVHVEAKKFAADGYTIVLIGHSGHEEVEGTMGEAPESIVLVETEADVDALTVADPEKVAYISQTTLSVDETTTIINRLRQKFPKISGPRTDDICYATTNRQAAVKAIAARCDALLVIGAPNSSNSVRLVEVAEREGARAKLIGCAADVDLAWLDGIRTLGITAGASAPETLVRELVDSLRSRFDVTEIESQGIVERMVFKLPHGLAAREGTSEAA